MFDCIFLNQNAVERIAIGIYLILIIDGVLQLAIAAAILIVFNAWLMIKRMQVILKAFVYSIY